MARSVRGRIRSAEDRAKFLEIRRVRDAYYASLARGEKPTAAPDPEPVTPSDPEPSAPVLKPAVMQVDIPDDWRSMSWQSRRRLAAGLSETPILNSDDAEAAILAALKRRAE